MDKLVKQRQLEASSAYIHGCYRELLALKPGNVGVHAAGHQMTVDHFQHSAHVSAQPLSTPVAGLGNRILASVKATQKIVGCNTNLGIILLCAPIMQAYIDREQERSLQHGVMKVLRETTINDARLCYEAIRIASPGGLGTAAKHDVDETPEITLMAAMQVAASHDRIAFQFANGFIDIFNYSMPKLAVFREAFPSQDNWAVSALYLTLLSRFPDTHIARKQGADAAREISNQAVELKALLLEQGPSQQVQEELQQVDKDWKNAGINPGTTADLVVATLVAEELNHFFMAGHTDVSADNLQEVKDIFFPTNKHLKEVHYGSN